MKHYAVCVCLIQDGMILAMRGRDGRVGLPGGKVEPDESDMDAALRELAEEAGCTVASRPSYVFDTDSCITFIYPDAVVHGTPRGNGREGTPVWMKPSNLTGPHGKFREYNTGLVLALEKFGVL